MATAAAGGVEEGPFLSPAAFASPWLDAVCAVTFDVDFGQKLDACFRESALWEKCGSCCYAAVLVRTGIWEAGKAGGGQSSSLTNHSSTPPTLFPYLTYHAARDALLSDAEAKQVASLALPEGAALSWKFESPEMRIAASRRGATSGTAAAAAAATVSTTPGGDESKSGEGSVAEYEGA